MDAFSDTSIASAMVRATMVAEQRGGGTSSMVNWKTSLIDNLIPQAFILNQGKLEDGSCYQSRSGKQRPTKTSYPPSAVHLDSSFLLDRIVSLQKHALVGRWHFPSMEDGQFRIWIGDNWNALLGYIPKIVRLMNNWYSFHFLKEQDLEIIFSLPWVHDKSFLALHKWYIGFNPLRSTPQNNYIWVKLLSLPIELWSKETLAVIGNAIGKFIYVDPKCLGAKDKRVAWILIEKEYRGGFPEYIDFSWDSLAIQQRLDYWGVPFRCSICHKTGHLKVSCPRRPVGRQKGKEHIRKFSGSRTELCDIGHNCEYDLGKISNLGHDHRSLSWDIFLEKSSSKSIK